MLTHALTTGKVILIILAEEPGLSAKQVYHRVLRQTGKSISYQAVHKKMSAYVKDGVIAKNGRAFMICDTWLNEISGLVEIARTRSSNLTQTVTENAPIREIRSFYSEKKSEGNPSKEPFYYH